MTSTTTFNSEQVSGRSNVSCGACCTRLKIKIRVWRENVTSQTQPNFLPVYNTTICLVVSPRCIAGRCTCHVRSLVVQMKWWQFSVRNDRLLSREREPAKPGSRLRGVSRRLHQLMICPWAPNTTWIYQFTAFASTTRVDIHVGPA